MQARLQLSRAHTYNVEKSWPWAHTYVGSQNQRRACCYSRNWRRDFVWGAHDRDSDF